MMAGMNSLDALFEDELRDVYDAERQILKALPKMIKAAENDDLRSALESHLEETRAQVDRLEQAFTALDLKARGKHCAGMAGILEEGSDLMGEDGDAAVLDAGFIAAAQRVEHYEITAYGTLIAWANTLGHAKVVPLLQANLKEEKAADQKLSALAESGLNALAARADEQREGSEEPTAKPRTRAAGRR
jgi:ferritin-like metal-binding protein YciE